MAIPEQVGADIANIEKARRTGRATLKLHFRLKGTILLQPISAIFLV